MKRKRGRSGKGEVRPPKAETRLERKAAGDMTLGQMLDDLPKACDIGAKVDAQGFKKSWVGYKFHIDTAGAGIPIGCDSHMDAFFSLAHSVPYRNFCHG